MTAHRTLVLVRHGRTAWNAEQRAQGHSDVPLDEVGHRQAAALAPAIAALSPVSLRTSDLTRARQTAAYLAEATGLVPVEDPRLREYDLGLRTGMTMPEYAEAFPDEYAAFRQGRYEVVPGGESTAEVVARVCEAACESFEALTPGECGVVVAHGAALKVSVVSLLGWDESQAATLQGLDNCGWVVLDDSGHDWRLRLVAYNRTAPDFASPSPIG
ncbi:histidine phosphatase family protein [Nocardioides gansuensis]|uniref:histidine phosphatase family protein n=1 Tax=Nocardioides gansuensis TaxID=2138300 RepID=UPI001401E45F|nr:histidine phosphatase family protein [Nocardioides gansuensis]